MIFIMTAIMTASFRYFFCGASSEVGRSLVVVERWDSFENRTLFLEKNTNMSSNFIKVNREVEQ
jgi:hypothetical protein